MIWLAFGALFFLQLAVIGIVIKKLSNSKNLQDPRVIESAALLESKILALHDFLENADGKIRSMMNLLDVKTRMLEEQKLALENEERKINRCLENAKETMDLFQEKIPNEEFLDRKNSNRYLQAAKLSNEGRSLAEIAALVDIPQSEIELIFKLNSHKFSYQDQDFEDIEPQQSEASLPPETLNPALSVMGDRIRQLAAAPQPSLPAPAPPKSIPSATLNSTPNKHPPAKNDSLKAGAAGKGIPAKSSTKSNSTLSNSSTYLEGTTARGERIQVKKFEFPRLTK